MPLGGSPPMTHADQQKRQLFSTRQHRAWSRILPGSGSVGDHPLRFPAKIDPPLGVDAVAQLRVLRCAGGCVFGGVGVNEGRRQLRDGVGQGVFGLPRVFRTAVFASIYAARCEFR